MIQGIFAPIATPFLDGEVAYGKLEENVGEWGKTELSGLVVMGSNGEAPYIDEDEKAVIWAHVRKCLPQDKMLIAGTGQESTRATVRLTKVAADAGAEAALVISPSYFKASMNQAALYGFYTDVADASPIPILIYNMPGNTGLNLPSALVVRLAAHPNIVGVKDSGGNIVQISEVIAGAPDDFSVFAGSASFLLPAVAMGARGGTLATANILPDLCVRIFNLTKQGKIEEAREIQKSILRLNYLVTGGYGVAGLKAALDMLGYFGGEPRKPMLPVGRAERAEIRGELQKLGRVPAEAN